MSVNYNEDADKDDGSCEYESKAVFWFDFSVASTLDSMGVTSLTFYVDGAVIATESSPFFFWSSAPECDEIGTNNVTQELADNKSITKSYSVKDQSGLEIWAATIPFYPNICTSRQLIL